MKPLSQILIHDTCLPVAEGKMRGIVRLWVGGDTRSRLVDGHLSAHGATIRWVGAVGVWLETGWLHVLHLMFCCGRRPGVKVLIRSERRPRVAPGCDVGGARGVAAGTLVAQTTSHQQLFPLTLLVVHLFEVTRDVFVHHTQELIQGLFRMQFCLIHRRTPAMEKSITHTTTLHYNNYCNFFLSPKLFRYCFSN